MPHSRYRSEPGLAPGSDFFCYHAVSGRHMPLHDLLSVRVYVVLHRQRSSITLSLLHREFVDAIS